MGKRSELYFAVLKLVRVLGGNPILLPLISTTALCRVVLAGHVALNRVARVLQSIRSVTRQPL